MKLTVTNVDRVVGSAGVTWIVKYSVEREAGEKTSLDHRISPEFPRFIHAFPEERLVSIVEEYGLNGDDRDAVMDVVLAEPFLDDNDGEPGLFSGLELSVIREAHLRRCAKAKLAVRLSTRGIRNPVEIIRSTAVSGHVVDRIKDSRKGQ